MFSRLLASFHKKKVLSESESYKETKLGDDSFVRLFGVDSPFTKVAYTCVRERYFNPLGRNRKISFGTNRLPIAVSRLVLLKMPFLLRPRLFENYVLVHGKGGSIDENVTRVTVVSGGRV